MKKTALFLLVIILFGACVARLYKFSQPVADWHSWRQADTSAVTRNFVKDGFDLLHPRFDDISNVPSGLDNPEGYRFVEFPLYNGAQAGLYMLFGTFTLEAWGRLVSITSSLLSIIFLYLLVRKYAGERVGLLSALFFGILPYNIYYSRTILPDPSMVMAILGGTYFFDRWLSSNVILGSVATPVRQWPTGQARMTGSFWLSIIFTASAFLLKPFALFFTLPMIYFVFRKWGIGMIKKPELWLFAFFAVAPLIFWRIWMQQFPEGIPGSDWLFNGGNIRFKGAFFYWIFAERIGRLILGYWGIALLVFGIIRKREKEESWFFFSFLASSLLYLFVIARGNVQHDYYQILIIPTLVIFLAKGADFLLTAPRELFHRVTCCLLLVACCLAMLGFSWYHVRDYFNINNRSIVVAGEAVDRLTPKDAKVIAPMEGDTSFLYQTNRKGWPSFQKPIEEMIVMGANYLVLTNPTPNDFTGFGSMYKIVSVTEEYILFDLKSRP